MDTWTLDGLPLVDPDGRWFFERGTGVRVMPGRRNASIEIPDVDGTMPMLGANFDPSSVLIKLVVCGDTHGEFMENLELVNGVLSQRWRLLPLVHDYGNGQKRQAMIQVADSIEPDLYDPRTALLKILASVPGVFWRDPDTTDSTVNVTGSRKLRTLTALGGSTGPVVDSLVRVGGKFSTASLTDSISGDEITVNVSCKSGEYVVVDTAAWTARKVTKDTWSGGSDVSAHVVSNRGSGPMLTLNPDFNTGSGRVRVRSHGTNATGAAVTVRAKRSFL